MSLNTLGIPTCISIHWYSHVFLNTLGIPHVSFTTLGIPHVSLNTLENTQVPLNTSVHNFLRSQKNHLFANALYPASFPAVLISPGFYSVRALRKSPGELHLPSHAAFGYSTHSVSLILNSVMYESRLRNGDRPELRCSDRGKSRGYRVGQERGGGG